MIATIITITTQAFIAIGVYTDVVQPAAHYSWDKAKQGYEYVEQKINPDA
jgi:hypothetical protein